MSGYQSRTIKAVLRKKFNCWVESIKDESLQKLVKENTIITGGCIVSMLTGEQINDFDLYFRSYSVAFQVARYYIKIFKAKKEENGGKVLNIYLADDAKIPIESDTYDKRFRIIVKSAGAASVISDAQPYEYFEQDDESGEKAQAFIDEVTGSKEKEKTEYSPVFLSTNAITLSDKIQIIGRYAGEPDVIHENYDFDHCKSYWTSWDSNLVLRPESLEAILSKRLVYSGSRYPICSMIRVRKFVQRGWRISAGQILKMAMQISELDLKDINVLEEQLTGVDAAYFGEIISILQKKMEETNTKEIDSTYLMKLIDKIF